jgi:tetratricopeptide (TPR) repeat protein/transglutaminase-like putative cysteine protease
MPRPRAIAVFLCLLAFCALAVPSPLVADTLFAAADKPAPAGPVPGPANSPYELRLANLQAQLENASAPQAVVLLGRIYGLREFVADPTRITRCIEKLAADPQQHPLVRDEALRYLAQIDVHENRLAAAQAKLQTLGFIRTWTVAGPFAALQGLDASYGPETNGDLGIIPAAVAKLDTSAGRSDPERDRDEWRAVPAGPTEQIDLAALYPPAGPSVVLAAASVYSEAPRTVALRFSAESAVAVFVNGSRVFTDGAGNAGVGFDQHAVSINLQAGRNGLVLKLLRHNESPWRFAVRITELNGGGLAQTVDKDTNKGSASCGASATTCGLGSISAPPADLVDMAQAAVDSDPGSASALETLGRMEHLHARGAGLQHLQAAARRAPTAERWLAVADVCGDSACVFSAASSALHSDPDNERARVILANYYFGRNQLEKSRNLLREAIQLDPHDFVARNNLTELYVSVGLNAQALEQAEQLQRESPGPLWVKRKLGSRYLDLGLVDRAQQILSTALEQNYDGDRERMLLIQIARRRHDVKGLRAAYEEMARLNPFDPAPLADLAELEAGAGDYALADRTMRAAAEIAPGNGSLRERWSNLLARLGKTDEARRQLARAVELEPHNEETRTRLKLGSSREQSDCDAEYLANPAELAAAVRRNPPAITGNAVALADIRIERVYGNGLSAVREQQVFYLATAQAARDYSTRSVQYAPASQELRVVHARVYKSDGRVLEADDAGDNAVANANVSMYYDVRSRVLRFPALERGDVIELDYRTSPANNVNPYGDYFGGLVVFQSNIAKKLRRYVLITPIHRQFNIIAQRIAPAVVTTSAEERIYRWEARDVAPLPSEPRGPAITEIAPYVHVSTFGSWAALGRWYAQLIQPQFALDAGLREAAIHLLKGAHTEQERISAIHQFVLRNTHYVAMEFGIYSYKPYPVTQTYARRFGDCKDKASLMIALLRQAGVEANIALVRTRRLGEVDPQAASVALFNHAIVYVPKYDLWLDGTAEYAGLRELPLEDQGATALVVAQDGRAELRRIPITQPSDNYVRRTVRAQVLADGRVQFTGVTYTRGEEAPGLRREYESPERQRDAVRNSLAEIFPSVHVEDVKVDGANDLERPVTVEFRGTLDSFSGRTSVPLTSSWLPRTYVQTMARESSRTQDLLLPAPWTADEELHFELPAGATVAAMPSDTVLETAFGSASLHYERQGREIVVRTSIQFRKLRIPPAEYDSFREFCVQVERAFRNEVKVKLRG